MKKIIILAIFAAVLSSCITSTQISDIRPLEIGMSRAQVDAYWGTPRRILSLDYTRDGVIETVEYRAYYNDVYAVQFVNGYVSSYYVLYSEFYTRPRPQNNRPNRPSTPNRPNRPSTPNRPERPDNNRPDNNRPDNNRPGNNQPSRPTQEVRPVKPGESTRPNTNNDNSKPEQNKPNTDRPTFNRPSQVKTDDKENDNK